MASRLQWMVLVSLWATRLIRDPTPTVRVSGGLVRGELARDGSHARYLGVPYATFPSRFQSPLLEPHWDGIFEAYEENIRCTQRFTNTMVLGQEECLTLNVYTPIDETNKLRPVMVFIHGGGFRDGSGSPFIYGPEYLVKHGVILVTFNYRLEILGFLCLGIKEAPGNMGLKDQVKAFKWIRRNIKAFGGDPDNVTIFGESAGAASVIYHLVSPMSRGLFQKAIVQSGSAMSPWSLQFEPLKTAHLLARQMGYNTEDPYELYNIFINKTAEELLKTRVPRANGDVVLSENIFVPCVEKKIDNLEQFLPDTPYNLLIKGLYHKVPIIIGYNSAEGYMFVGKENDTTLTKLDFLKALPRDLIFPTKDEMIETANDLKQLYMGDDIISKETLVKFSKFAGESGITYPTIATVDLLLETSDKPIYTYKFNYDGWLNIAKMFYGFGRAQGATHADDLFYIFKFKIPLVTAFFEADIVHKITYMWTNFAKFGDPTPEVTSPLQIKWRTTDKRDPHILVIDKEFSTSRLWADETIRYWNKTYFKYRRKNARLI